MDRPRVTPVFTIPFALASNTTLVRRYAQPRSLGHGLHPREATMQVAVVGSTRTTARAANRPTPSRAGVTVPLAQWPIPAVAPGALFGTFLAPCGSAR
eukprot:gene11829-10230_t